MHVDRDMKQSLQALTSILGVAGFEDRVIRHVRAEASLHSREVEVDALGNILAHLPSRRSDAPKVVVMAHMDEVGFIVRKVEDDGFVRLERIGGVPEKSASGTAVLAEPTPDERLFGVVGPKAHHLTGQDEKYAVVPIQRLYADFGFGDRQAATDAGLVVGTPVGYARTFEQRGEMVFSNALDDRGGCWALLEVLRRSAGGEPPVELWVVASVQEEFSLRGVLPAIRKIAPDYVLDIDVAVATDTPDLAGYTNVRLGGGPTVGVMSFHGRGTLAGLIPNPRLLDLVRHTASSQSIPLQANTFMGGLTETSFLQLEQGGIPALDLGFPCRYTHAPVEAAHLGDLDQLVELILALLEGLAERPSLARG